MATCLPRFIENGSSWGSEVTLDGGLPTTVQRERFLGEVKLLWMATCLPRFIENCSSRGSEVTLNGGLPTTVHRERFLLGK